MIKDNKSIQLTVTEYLYISCNIISLFFFNFYLSLYAYDNLLYFSIIKKKLNKSFIPRKHRAMCVLSTNKDIKIITKMIKFVFRPTNKDIKITKNLSTQIEYKPDIM